MEAHFAKQQGSVSAPAGGGGRRGTQFPACQHRLGRGRGRRAGSGHPRWARRLRQGPSRRLPAHGRGAAVRHPAAAEEDQAREEAEDLVPQVARPGPGPAPAPVAPAAYPPNPALVNKQTELCASPSLCDRWLWARWEWERGALCQAGLVLCTEPLRPCKRAVDGPRAWDARAGSPGGSGRHARCLWRGEARALGLKVLLCLRPSP